MKIFSHNTSPKIAGANLDEYFFQEKKKESDCDQNCVVIPQNVFSWIK